MWLERYCNVFSSVTWNMPKVRIRILPSDIMSSLSILGIMSSVLIFTSADERVKISTCRRGTNPLREDFGDVMDRHIFFAHAKYYNKYLSNFVFPKRNVTFFKEIYDPNAPKVVSITFLMLHGLLLVRGNSPFNLWKNIKGNMHHILFNCLSLVRTERLRSGMPSAAWCK